MQRECNAPDKSDWRLRGQEEYMQGMAFTYLKFSPETEGRDHTHCEFCWHKFMEKPESIADCSSHGYRSRDGRYWVCEECFAGFKDAFGWNPEE